MFEEECTTIFKKNLKLAQLNVIKIIMEDFKNLLETTEITEASGIFRLSFFIYHLNIFYSIYAI